MTRIASTVLIFLILTNGATTVMVGSGLAEDFNINLGGNIDNTMDELIENAQTAFSPNTGIVESLLSLLVSGFTAVKLFFQSLTAAPTLFIGLGFPTWVVFPFFAPMYLVSTLELIFLATGRDMV